MPQQVHQHTFANGLTLLAERMEHVRSAAMYFLVPAGCAFDPPDFPGVGGILADMLTRGAGELDSQQLTMALDNLGLDRSEGVGLMHMRFWGTTLARNLPAALRLYADILRRPHLPEDELEPCQALAIQDIKGLEDEPGSRVMVELRRHLYPPPLSNDHRGTVEGVEGLTLAALKKQHGRLFRPNGTILSVAGNVEWEPLRDLVGELFADWPGAAEPPLTLGQPPGKRAHLTKELEQTQIAIGFPSVPVGDSDYYAALGAVNVLSGGMGARLFTEIREKEGLCYSVGASYQPMKDRGSVIAYAASLNHQAQRTLDKLLEELQKLPRGIEDEEVDRVRVGLKTSLIMQQESTSARATSLASDWYYLGRVRGFDEIQSAIEGLSAASILAHLRRHPPVEFSIVTLGPSPLTAAG
ncbi:MAG: pitrilysin family protein [Gemmataceae bacterium]